MNTVGAIEEYISVYSPFLKKRTLISLLTRLWGSSLILTTVVSTLPSSRTSSIPALANLNRLPITNSSIDGKSCVSTYKGIESDELTAYIESASNDPKKSGAVIGVRTLNYKYFRSRYDSKKNINLQHISAYYWN